MHPTQQARIRREGDGRRPRFRQGAIRSGSLRSVRAQDGPSYVTALPAPAHLLIAEDDREMRRFLVEVFEGEGYLVTEAENGEMLRRRLSESGLSPGVSAPDIVVSDIRLPGLTGLELLAELRRTDWSLPVILITAFGDESVHLEGKRLGAARVFDKPFDAEDLVEAVSSLVPAS